MDWEAATESVLDITTKSLGIAATYTPTVGDPVAIKGVFGNAHVEVGSNPPISLVAPVLTIQLSDLESDPANGDEVTVRGIDYRIIDVQKDGEGGASLVLQNDE